MQITSTPSLGDREFRLALLSEKPEEGRVVKETNFIWIWMDDIEISLAVRESDEAELKIKCDACPLRRVMKF